MANRRPPPPPNANPNRRPRQMPRPERPGRYNQPQRRANPRENSVNPANPERTRRPPPPKPPRGVIKPRQPQGRVLPFKIIETKDTIYTVHKRPAGDFPWRKLAISFAIILIGGIGSAATHAQVTNTQNAINARDRQLHAVRTENFQLSETLRERYTFYEIERMAHERLGMAMPDPSQIVIINVPRIGGVTLNPDDSAVQPTTPNYFMQEIRIFVSGIFDRMFGGGN